MCAWLDSDESVYSQSEHMGLALLREKIDVNS